MSAAIFRANARQFSAEALYRFVRESGCLWLTECAITTRVLVEATTDGQRQSSTGSLNAGSRAVDDTGIS